MSNNASKPVPGSGPGSSAGPKPEKGPGFLDSLLRPRVFSSRLSKSLPAFATLLFLSCGITLGLCALQQRSLSASAPQAGATKTDFPRLGREIADIVRLNFFDAKRAEAWFAQYGGYADGVMDEETFSQRTRTALDALHSSHTGYYRPNDPAYFGLLSIFESLLRPEGVWYESIGVDTVQEKDSYFVRDVFAGSPAAKAGILRGDWLVSADGMPFQPIASFRSKAGPPVNVIVQHIRNESPVSVQVVPRRIKPREEWLEAQMQGTRIFTRGDRRIGYIPFFSGAGEQYQEAAQDAISGPLQQADALILDFRDGFGGFNPDFVTLFDRTVPRLTFHDRSGKTTILDRQWRKPLFILINGGSRSGKEVVAFSLQKQHRATLVGERTAGAVLGGKPFLLSDGSLLYLAVTDGTVDGQRLEGKGVKPDIIVPDSLPFAAGADIQLEKALKRAEDAR